MTGEQRTFLQNPQGTEGIYLEEAYRHRQITHHLDHLFSRWGYLPVETPVFDFYDTYSNLIGKQNSDKIYRLIDRDGDMLMLRSDITLFLAKQMGIALQPEDLPVRVYYSDTILRHQNFEDISKNEFFQVGAELIGKEGLDGDLEILTLLTSTMKELDISFNLHIGSQALFSAVFSDFSEEEQQELTDTIVRRDFDRLKQLASARLNLTRCEEAAKLFQFIGTADQFKELIGKIEGLSPSALKEANYLVELASELLKISKSKLQLRIDLSELANQPYYTGIAFKVYKDGFDSAIATGGRYDKLLSNFGFNSPSVGFSIMLRKIEHLLSTNPKFNIPEQAIRVSEKTFAESFRKAEEIRKKGGTAIL